MIQADDGDIMVLLSDAGGDDEEVVESPKDVDTPGHGQVEIEASIDIRRGSSNRVRVLVLELVRTELDKTCEQPNRSHFRDHGTRVVHQRILLVGCEIIAGGSDALHTRNLESEVSSGSLAVISGITYFDKKSNVAQRVHLKSTLFAYVASQIANHSASSITSIVSVPDELFHSASHSDCYCA